MKKTLKRTLEKPPKRTPYTTYGFTIVELLIVIVIIAILAAITLVAYNGIQNRANDTVVQSDMASTYKKLALYNGEFGTYPAVSDTVTLKTVFIASKGSYKTGAGTGAYLYCRSDTDAAVLGYSKSGKAFYAGSNGSGTISIAWSGQNATLCPSAGIQTSATGYGFFWYYQSTPTAGWIW